MFAYRAARHGLRLSGKLKRIKDQEQRNISSDKVRESSSPMSELGAVTQRRTQSRTIHTRQLEMIRRTGTDIHVRDKAPSCVVPWMFAQ